MKAKKFFTKRDIIIHPGYDYLTKENNIAVIRLEHPVSPDGSKYCVNDTNDGI